jgi:hypothetical protein
MRENKRKTYFAFFSYADIENCTCIRFFHSLIFQILFDEPSLRPVILDAYKTNYRKLKSDLNYVISIFISLVTDSDRKYLVADGVDELSPSEREYFLKTLMEVMRDCHNLSVYLSSRAEKDIANALILNGFTSIRVDHHNSSDIESFVCRRSDDIVSNMRSYGAGEILCSQVRALLVKVAQKAQGGLTYKRQRVDYTNQCRRDVSVCATDDGNSRRS